MKKFVFLMILAISASACTKKTLVLKAPPGQVKKTTDTNSAKSNAPGQQKKAAGTQSAKSFAPGQQKKKTTGTQTANSNGSGEQKKNSSKKKD